MADVILAPFYDPKVTNATIVSNTIGTCANTGEIKFHPNSAGADARLDTYHAIYIEKNLFSSIDSQLYAYELILNITFTNLDLSYFDYFNVYYNFGRLYISNDTVNYANGLGDDNASDTIAVSTDPISVDITLSIPYDTYVNTAKEIDCDGVTYTTIDRHKSSGTSGDPTAIGLWLAFILKVNNISYFQYIYNNPITANTDITIKAYY
jgi:hypothetical protein